MIILQNGLKEIHELFIRVLQHVATYIIKSSTVIFKVGYMLFLTAMFFSQSSVRLTPATMLYVGKSPDGQHILVITHSCPLSTFIPTHIGAGLLKSSCFSHLSAHKLCFASVFHHYCIGDHQSSICVL